MTMTKPKTGDATDRLNPLVRFSVSIPRPNTKGPWISQEKPKRQPRGFCPACAGWGDRTIFRIKCKACGGTGFKPNATGERPETRSEDE